MINETMQAYIKGLTEIANSPKVKKICSPNVFPPLEIKEWQVERILYAQSLLMNQASSTESSHPDSSS